MTASARAPSAMTGWNGWRADLRRALCRRGRRRRCAFLAPAVAHYGLRQEDFLTVIDGMDMDVAEDIVAPDLATLDLYCDRVASAVGRLSIKVFGMEEGPGFELAHHLGRALQLTNILRDIDEDAAIGRLYLPREYLFEAGFTVARSRDGGRPIPRIDRVCRKVAALAHEHYDKAAARSWRASPRAASRTPRLMGAVYSRNSLRQRSAGLRAAAPPRLASARASCCRWCCAHGLF